MKEEQIWELIVLKLSGEATPAQEAELQEALRQHPDLAFQLGILEELWKRPPQGETLPAADHFNRHLQRLSHHLSEAPLQYETTEPAPAAGFRRRRLYRLAGLAAAVLLCGALVFAFFSTRHSKPSAMAEHLVCTRNGSRSKLQLPDGTNVWLNAGSKITYGNDFNGPVRRVALQGEAFFEVAPDADAPFVIHTNMVEVKVLGTSLNVRAYTDEKVTETALISGAVEITLHKSPEKKIILRPEEKLIVRNDSPAVKMPAPLMTLTQVRYWSPEKDSTPMETLWIKNKLVFDDETLEQVALKLERWYGVDVVIQNEQLKHVAYTAVFEDEALPEVLYALHLTGNFQYTIRKKEVIITP